MKESIYRTPRNPGKTRASTKPGAVQNENMTLRVDFNLDDQHGRIPARLATQPPL
jgi:hypothetical protein